MKIRQNLYIDRDICEELSRLARGHVGNKSRLANDALRNWLELRRNSELDSHFKLRLDKLSRELDAARRDIDLLVEPPTPVDAQQVIALSTKLASRLYRLMGERRIDILVGFLKKAVASAATATKAFAIFTVLNMVLVS